MLVQVKPLGSGAFAKVEMCKRDNGQEVRATYHEPATVYGAALQVCCGMLHPVGAGGCSGPQPTPQHSAALHLQSANVEDSTSGIPCCCRWR